MDSITTQRQRHRDDFTRRLRAAFPDPEHPVRQQAESVMNRWWPGTEPTPEDEEPS